MRITKKKEKLYEDADGARIVVTAYSIKTAAGTITYRVCDFWTTIIRSDGTICFVKKRVDMNEDDPADSIEKFESLLVLK